MKLACVIHRFGADIAGGSEGHCRALATHLAATHVVTVLTTCARDHITWQNTYPEGRSRDGALHVVRFPVARQRSLHRFAELSELVFSGRGSAEDEARWFRENGPDAPALLEHLDRHNHEYDRVLFWSFRYAPTFFGLPLVKGRGVLVPTAEEDPVIRFDSLERFFGLPAGFVFLTPEEAQLVSRRAGRVLTPSRNWYRAWIQQGQDPAQACSPPPGLRRRFSCTWDVLIRTKGAVRCCATSRAGSPREQARPSRS